MSQNRVYRRLAGALGFKPDYLVVKPEGDDSWSKPSDAENGDTLVQFTSVPRLGLSYNGKFDLNPDNDFIDFFDGFRSEYTQRIEFYEGEVRAFGDAGVTTISNGANRNNPDPFYQSLSNEGMRGDHDYTVESLYWCWPDDQPVSGTPLGDPPNVGEPVADPSGCDNTEEHLNTLIVGGGYVNTVRRSKSFSTGYNDNFDYVSDTTWGEFLVDGNEVAYFETWYADETFSVQKTNVSVRHRYDWTDKRKGQIEVDSRIALASDVLGLSSVSSGGWGKTILGGGFLPSAYLGSTGSGHDVAEVTFRDKKRSNISNDFTLNLSYTDFQGSYINTNGGWIFAPFPNSVTITATERQWIGGWISSKAKSDQTGHSVEFMTRNGNGGVTYITSGGAVYNLDGGLDTVASANPSSISSPDQAITSNNGSYAYMRDGNNVVGVETGTGDVIIDTQISGRIGGKNGNLVTLSGEGFYLIGPDALANHYILYDGISDPDDQLPNNFIGANETGAYAYDDANDYIYEWTWQPDATEVMDGGNFDLFIYDDEWISATA